jgi:F-type H+-transporting ATPase subunit delta
MTSMAQATLQGVSRDSLALARERLAQLVDAEGADPEQLADDLFAVTGLLDRTIALRRGFTDPAATPDAKAALAETLLRDRISSQGLDLVTTMVRAPWSRPRDVADAAELLAVSAAVTAAERDQSVDDVEDELFRFGRIVAADAALRGRVGDPRIPADAKQQLLQNLLGGKVRPITLKLVSRVVTAPRGRLVERGLEEYAEMVADERRRVLGTVRTAVPLTDEQKSRLRAVLRRMYQHDVQLNVVVDPDVVGGITVQVGDEVIDGSVATKLEQARKRLAG